MPPLAPSFLDERALRESAREAELGEAAVAALLELAARIQNTPELLAAACAAQHALYETSGDYAEALGRADAALGADAELLHALFVLDSIRRVHERQSARGVSAEISRAVNQRQGCAWLRAARDSQGVPRLAQWLPGWFRLVGSGELYRLGRLEFVPELWKHPYRVYVHAESSAALVLAEPGTPFSADGKSQLTPSWSASLHEADGAVIGTAISPAGHALLRPVRLPLSEWRLALARGQRVLDLHVPAEGELSLAALRAAFEQAMAFFDQHYPEPAFVAFTCDSWLFSNQLEALLSGADSNILRWQQQCYLLPGAGGHEAFLRFVFGAAALAGPPALAHETAPRDTRLRRAVLERLERGERLQDGVCLFLRRDLERFGSEPYRIGSQAALAALGVTL